MLKYMDKEQILYTHTAQMGCGKMLKYMDKDME